MALTSPDSPALVDMWNATAAETPRHLRQLGRPRHLVALHVAVLRCLLAVVLRLAVVQLHQCAAVPRQLAVVLRCLQVEAGWLLDPVHVNK